MFPLFYLRLRSSCHECPRATRFLLLLQYIYLLSPNNYDSVISEVSDPLRSRSSFLVWGVGITIHHIVNNRRSPHKIPIVPAGPSTVWTIARAVNAPRKEDMMPRNRISRDGTRRGEARHGSPNSSTSFWSEQKDC